MIKDSLDWVNKDMKSIRRVQSDVDILTLAESGKLEGPQEGFIIDTDERGWSVYFPSVRKVCTCVTDVEGIQYKKHLFTFHLFVDEHNLRKKVRISLVE